jgi:hypothetical protein
MDEVRRYTVVAYTGLYEVGQDNERQVTVIATSPEAAAEQALGLRLVRTGSVTDVRAKVTFDGLDGRPKTILLYRTLT